jgi:Galactose oxidase, central domain
MQDQPQREPGEGGVRRVNTRSVVALLCIIAVAGAIGIVISFSQRAQIAATRVSRTPTAAEQTLSPTPVPLEPQAGFGFSLADDLATHDIVLFGGVGDYPNTWLWNGSKWTLAHPSVSPAGRFGASAAYDPQTKSVMLFGGRLEPGMPVDDTWAWNGSTWDDLDTGVNGPPPGEGSDMAWDPATSQMILLTRSGVISSPAETWVWAGSNWRQPAGAALPPGATYSPMGFDPDTDSLLAVGCCVGPPPATGAVNTTWNWNGTVWTMLPTSIHAPIDGSTMALDPATGRLDLCDCDSSATNGSDLSAWDGSGWARLPAAALPLVGGVEITDSDRHELLLLGSAPSAAASGESPVGVWRWTGFAWVQIGPKP